MVMTNKDYTMDDFYDPKWGVFTFLQQIGLSQYYDMFLAKGFDSEKDISFVERKDLDTMCITNKKHRDLIISQASLYRPSEEQELYEWLRENMLEYYCINFLQSGRDSLDIIRKMELPDEEIYDDLEIMLPGHRKRLERAVARLQKQSQSSCTEVEYPVAYGRWMKPDYLEYAKFDFLCTDGIISSTINKDLQEKIVFMVDSGSDVVTLKADIVRRLNLVYKGVVRSQGVHVCKEKMMYEAILKIGTVELKIELIPEGYNSIGNRVLRHFRHYITGSRHVWLRGNYTDPSMEITPLEPDYTERKVDQQKENGNDSTSLEAEREAESVSDSETDRSQTLCEESNVSRENVRDSNANGGEKEEEKEKVKEKEKEKGEHEEQVREGPFNCTVSEKDFLPTTSQKEELYQQAKIKHKQCLLFRKRSGGAVSSVFYKKVRVN